MMSGDEFYDDDVTSGIDWRDVADTIRKERKEMPCQTCEDIRTKYSGFGPSHEAKPNCESGKHSHCSCDVCF